MAPVSLHSLFGRLSISAVSRTSVCTLVTPSIRSAIAPVSTVQRRAFSVSSTSLAPPQKSSKGGAGSKPKKKKKGKGEEPDARIRNIKFALTRTVPAPLRFARNRALRHWTIHRAWLLWQRKEREREERELMRLQQSMFNACEELRKTSGPGLRDEGYLYRVAMEKKGVFGHNSIPIEYTRPQTETPPRTPWNHDWTLE